MAGAALWLCDARPYLRPESGAGGRGPSLEDQPIFPPSLLSDLRTQGPSVAFSSAGRLPYCSPQRALTRHASKLQATPANSADRSQRLATAFCSPAAIVPFRNLRSGVNTPGLSCRHSPEPSVCPFGLWAPFPTFRLTPEWSRSIPSTRCRLTCPAATNPTELSLPFGVSPP